MEEDTYQKAERSPRSSGIRRNFCESKQHRYVIGRMNFACQYPPVIYLTLPVADPCRGSRGNFGRHAARVL